MQQLLERAYLSIGRLDSVSTLLPDTHLFLYTYVRKEALLSSQIEGTQSSLSELLLFELDDAGGAPLDDVVEVSNYVAALEHGLSRLREGFPLSNRLIREIHGRLLARGRGSDKAPGEFRTTQNWIKGPRPSLAHFVPQCRESACENSRGAKAIFTGLQAGAAVGSRLVGEVRRCMFRVTLLGVAPVMSILAFSSDRRIMKLALALLCLLAACGAEVRECDFVLRWHEGNAPFEGTAVVHARPLSRMAFEVLGPLRFSDGVARLALPVADFPGDQVVVLRAVDLVDVDRGRARGTSWVGLGRGAAGVRAHIWPRKATPGEVVSSARIVKDIKLSRSTPIMGDDWQRVARSSAEWLSRASIEDALVMPGEDVCQVVIAAAHASAAVEAVDIAVIFDAVERCPPAVVDVLARSLHTLALVPESGRWDNAWTTVSFSALQLHPGPVLSSWLADWRLAQGDLEWWTYESGVRPFDLPWLLFEEAGNCWQMEMALRFDRLHGHVWSSSERLESVLGVWRKWSGQRQVEVVDGRRRFHGLRFETALMLEASKFLDSLEEPEKSAVQLDLAAAKARGPRLNEMTQVGVDVGVMRAAEEYWSGNDESLWRAFEALVSSAFPGVLK